MSTEKRPREKPPQAPEAAPASAAGPAGPAESDGTQVGNVFISNYPPYAYWGAEDVPGVESLLASPPADDRALGVYVHIPFCRKRCDFCYFKVYTDKNSGQIRRYLDAVARELATFAHKPYIAGRRPTFLYFGGGTPSYLSVEQLRSLFGALREHLDFSQLREVTFECEPGTLSLPKVQALAELGVTRLSLGVENFSADVLEWNNRAHRAEEIHRTFAFARETGFDAINIDLIAGMVGETDENWERCIDETIRLGPDGVTVYQLEVPYNTTIYRRMQERGVEVAPVADWHTKRRWTAELFRRLAEAGYRQSSAYTAYRGEDVHFVYRDSLWRGADLLGLGVSSFSHLGGQHFQNEHSFEPYCTRVEAGQSPIARAYKPNEEERMIREFILQLKEGHIETSYFRDKFGVDVRERFRAPLEQHRAAGFLEVEEDEIRTTEAGLLQVDGLLPAFFLERHRGERYV